MSVRLPSPAKRQRALLAGLNDAQQRAAAFGMGDSDGAAGAAATARCSSSPAPAPARRLTLAAPRRAPRPRRRRSAAHPAADVLAPRCAARWSGASAACCSGRSLAATQQAPRAALVPAPSTASARACCASTRARIGLDASFTIHDRGDSEDLIGLVRQRARAGERASARFPQKGTCLAIYSRVGQRRGAARATCWRDLSRGAASGRPSCSALFARLRRRRSSAQHVLDFDDLLLSGGPGDGRARSLGAQIGGALRPRAGRRIPGHQPPAGRDPARAEARRRGVTVVGDDAQSIYSFRAADGAQHPRLPARSSRRRRAVVTLEQQLPLDAADPRRRRTRSSRCAASATPRTLWSDRRVGRAAARWSAVDGRGRPGALGRRARAGAARGGARAEEPGGAVPHARTTATRSSSSWRGATSRSSSSAA